MTWSKPPSDFLREEVIPAQAFMTRELSFEVFNRVALKTPRKTGRAAASWNHSEGVSDESIRPEGTYAFPTLKPTGGTFRSGGFQADIPAYPVYYVTNALPYIGKLETGSSRQAPAGMVGTTLAELNGLFS